MSVALKESCYGSSRLLLLCIVILARGVLLDCEKELSICRGYVYVFKVMYNV